VVAAVAKVAHLTRAFFVWQHFFYITDERLDDTGLRRTHARSMGLHGVERRATLCPGKGAR